MTTPAELADAIARTRRLVELYRTRTITSVALLDQVAELVTPENVEELVGLLPSEVKAQLGEWARRLPRPEDQGMVCWPLPERTTLSFKEWLRRQEERERRG